MSAEGVKGRFHVAHTCVVRNVGAPFVAGLSADVAMQRGGCGRNSAAPHIGGRSNDATRSEDPMLLLLASGVLDL